MKKVSRKNYEADLERLQDLERFYGGFMDYVSFRPTTKYNLQKNQPPYVQIAWAAGGSQLVEDAEKFLAALQVGITLAKQINDKYRDCIFED